MRKGVFALLLVTTAAIAQPPGGGPPPQAIDACRGQSQGEQCGFQAPHGRIEGSCRQVPEGLVCAPDFADRGAGGNRPETMAQPFAQDRAAAQSGSDRPGTMGRQGAPFGADIAKTGRDARAVAGLIPDTNQGSCFDNSGMRECPRDGEAFHGQDAQYSGAEPSYSVQQGIVTDRVTGLMWQQAHNATRLSWPAARQACERLTLGGYDDWRLPSITELFSIADFRGSQGRRPYLDEVFEIREPDASILRDDPFAATHSTDMMGQTWSATLYSGNHWDRKGVEAAFFMNFLDGHIKQSPTGGGRSELFYRCVRGESWGDNDFVDNGDGTVTDRAAELTWQQRDDGRTRNWQQALAYCETLELSGHTDWRLPNIKELQSIVDYSRHDPALDSRFLEQQDRRGWFWSSTTHGDNIRQADYICFGKCVSSEGVDVHGAGAQRSDPKASDVRHGSSQGGQHDEIRIDNYVRCVR